MDVRALVESRDCLLGRGAMDREEIEIRFDDIDFRKVYDVSRTMLACHESGYLGKQVSYPDLRKKLSGRWFKRLGAYQKLFPSRAHFLLEVAIIKEAGSCNLDGLAGRNVGIVLGCLYVLSEGVSDVPICASSVIDLLVSYGFSKGMFGLPG